MTSMIYAVAEKCGAVHPPSLLELGRQMQVIGHDIEQMHAEAMKRAEEKRAKSDAPAAPEPGGPVAAANGGYRAPAAVPER